MPSAIDTESNRPCGTAGWTRTNIKGIQANIPSLAKALPVELQQHIKRQTIANLPPARASPLTSPPDLYGGCGGVVALRRPALCAAALAHRSQKIDAAFPPRSGRCHYRLHGSCPVSPCHFSETLRQQKDRSPLRHLRCPAQKQPDNHGRDSNPRLPLKRRPH